eukprot:Skav218444  [mRNA]  locus=scaffold905:62195:64267:+ [translate_table: standard]
MLQIDLAPHQITTHELVTRVIQLVSRTKWLAYLEKMKQHPELECIIGAVRRRFIDQQLRTPTVVAYHGFAGEHDQPQNLKLVGRLAAVMIGRGHPDEESLETARKLVSEVPMKVKNLSTMRDNKAYSTILELCIERGINLNSINKTTAVERLQKFFRSKKLKQKSDGKQNEIFDLTQLIIADGVFQNASGEPMSVQSQWSVGAKGLSLATKSEIAPYVKQAKLLTSEINSVLLNEPVQCVEPIKCTQHTIPVLDMTGNKALIQVWAVHFGVEKVTHNPPMEAEMSSADTVIVVISVQKELVDPEWWSKFLRGPAKLLMQTMFTPVDRPEVSQIWSRRWSLDGKLSDPMLANGFSLLCSVKAGDIKDWLRSSGLGSVPIFVSPKPGQVFDDLEMRIIWLSKTIHETAVQVATVPDHLGVIYKRPSSFGLRVLARRFPSIWAELKPNQKPPEFIKCTRKYVMDGIPPSMNASQVEQMCQATSWKIKVLRRYSDGRYLVGGEDSPAKDTIAMQDSMILITEYKETPKQTQKSIVAGKLAMTPIARNSPQDEDPLMRNDPWLVAREQRVAKWRTAHGNNNAMDTNEDGQNPTQEVLAKQSDRIATVEAKLSELQQQMQVDRASTAEKFQEVHNNLGEVQTTLKQSLTDALQAQSQTLLTQFEALLKPSPRVEASEAKGSRSRSPPTRAKAAMTN